MAWYYEPSDEITRYLHDMQDAIRYGLQVAYRMSVRDHGMSVPSPIALRREVRDWFYTRFDYARHHVNPVCRTSVALLRSYRKNHRGELRIPEVRRLAMRVSGDLFKLVDGRIRVTLQPGNYAWVQINAKNKHYEEYSKGKTSELLITDRKACLTFVVGNDEKPLGNRFIASDLNFDTIDSTKASIRSQSTLDSVETEPLEKVVQIQNDFSKRRRMLQKHVRNPQKRIRKLIKTRGRQSYRIRDVLHKLSTEQVTKNPDATFVFENLRGIRRNGESKSKKLRTYLNRWPYHMYQSMVQYKSPNRTLYVSPRGTSSECPVCGGELKHPTWGTSRCNTCGVDYGRDRLASLAILCRGMRLCGQPFAVSADASWQLLKSEYLYAGSTPESARAGWTEAANAPNESVHTKLHI